MSDHYEVAYHRAVEADLRALDRSARRRGMDAVESRLAQNPGDYGRPLGGALAGLRRVRVGDYRVCYRVSGRVVVIFAVRHRKDVYAAVLSRVLGLR